MCDCVRGAAQATQTQTHDDNFSLVHLLKMLLGDVQEIENTFLFFDIFKRRRRKLLCRNTPTFNPINILQFSDFLLNQNLLLLIKVSIIKVAHY